jgi:hypothetical protein
MATTFAPLLPTVVNGQTMYRRSLLRRLFFTVAMIVLIGTCLLAGHPRTGSQRLILSTEEQHATPQHLSAQPSHSPSPAEPIISSAPDVRVLVSYIYYESERHGECERNNKRTNLATFLFFAVVPSRINIMFHFTFPGLQPEAKEVLSSIGISASSDAGQQIIGVFRNQYSNVMMHNSSVSHPAADLCHHYHVIGREVHHVQPHYVFTTNDGVRGPFIGTEEAKAGQVWFIFCFDASKIKLSDSSLYL